MIELFNVVLYQPLLNLLVFFYNVIPGHDVGLAIIAMTLLIRLLLYPSSVKSIKSQKAMKDLQPKLDELKKKYANQKEKIASETMALYKSEKINPFSSCLPLLLQLPFLIAVYQVFRVGLTNGSLDKLYSFVYNPGTLNAMSFGIFDLSKPVIIFALLAGVAQFIQSKMLTSTRPAKEIATKEGAKDEDMSAIMNKQMLYMMPIITVVIGWTLPGGLTLYWFLSTLLMAGQQWIIFKQADKEKELPKIEVVN
ncbi:MAG: YidC/Oxa1 family membrane protein insertase [Patescibacteria group bacterium]